MEDRGSDIEQPTAEDEVVGLDAGPAGHEHPLWPVPDGDPGRHAGRKRWPQMIAVKAVVGDEDHGRVGPGQLHQPLEKHVVQPVDAGHHVAIQFEIGLRDPLHPRRVVGHEEVADLVHGPVIDRREVPVGIGLHEVRRRGMGRKGLRKFLGQHPEPLVFLLVDRVRLGHEQPDHLVGIEVVRAHAKIVHRLREFRRPVGAGGGRRPVGGRLVRRGARQVAEHVRHDTAVSGLLAVRGEPAHDMTPQAPLAQHLPERATPPRGGRHRHDPARVRIHLRESWHAVMVGHLAGGDARPEHRRELGLEGREIAAHACLDEPCQARHDTRVEEWMDDLPVGGIPADEQQPAGVAGSRARGRRPVRHRRRPYAGPCDAGGWHWRPWRARQRPASRW